MDVNIDIINVWNMYGQYAAFALYGLAVLMLLVYFVKLSSTKEPKDKYDFINKSEINMLWYATISVIIATAVIANTFIIDLTLLWLFVRLFLTVMMSIITGVIVQNILKFYYPFYIEKRLKKLRYQPRISPKNGKPMKLLSEEEEDVYLDEGMQAEEEAFSIDYDVWIDEATGQTKVEKYPGHLQALQCNNCGFYTMKVAREEIIQEPTEEVEGELIKHYECQYCGSIRATQHHIAKEEDYSNYKPEKLEFKSNTDVDLVKIEVVSTSGERKDYQFQSVEQAEKFLSEFDFEKSN